jgi:hypothetical protein
VRGGAPAGELIHRLSDEGYAVLLLARIDPTGERELNAESNSEDVVGPLAKSIISAIRGQ